MRDLFPFLSRSFATRLLYSRSFLEADGQGPCAHIGVFVQWYQQGSLQKAQPQHKIYVEGDNGSR